MKVLIIDDEPITNQTVKRMLSSNGIEADALTDARKGIPLVESGIYDFVLLDYLMPAYTGEWFMKHVHPPKRTKVILHTAYINRLVVNRMFKLGIAGYLQKPVAHEELLHHLDYHASRKIALPRDN